MNKLRGKNTPSWRSCWLNFFRVQLPSSATWGQCFTRKGRSGRPRVGRIFRPDCRISERPLPTVSVMVALCSTAFEGVEEEEGGGGRRRRRRRGRRSAEEICKAALLVGLLGSLWPARGEKEMDGDELIFMLAKINSSEILWTLRRPSEHTESVANVKARLGKSLVSLCLYLGRTGQIHHWLLSQQLVASWTVFVVLQSISIFRAATSHFFCHNLCFTSILSIYLYLSDSYWEEADWLWKLGLNVCLQEFGSLGELDFRVKVFAEQR